MTGRLLGRGSGLTLIVLSALGLASAWALTVDKVRLLEDPSYQPSCDLNPVLSCGSVIGTDQASVFGFPNPLIGLVGFSVIGTLAVLVTARVALPRWVMTGAAFGCLLGVVFVHWLAYQSLYEIGALCPWCLVVWAVTVPMALMLTLAAFHDGLLRRRRHGEPPAEQTHDRQPTPRAVGVGEPGALWRWRFSLVAGWYLVVGVLILIRFWDYWETQL